MNQGKIVEYIEHGKFLCALCLQDNGNKLHLLTSKNREVNLSPKRAVLISGSTYDTSKLREQLIEQLRHAEQMRSTLKDQVNVKELSELVRDEGETFDNKYLAQLVFGKSITDDHESGLMRALFEDNLYFKMKDGRFHANSEEQIDIILRQREKQALRQEKLKQGSDWLRAIKDGRTPEDSPFKQDIIALLIQLAVYGVDAPDLKYGKEMLAEAGIPDILEARNILVKLGIWEEDEHIELIRLGVQTSFTQDQLRESAGLAEKEISLNKREDLRGLHAFTIDGPLTRDYDDAVSMEIDGDSIHLGIHISDVSALILPGTILDHEAASRASSHYFPRGEIPMLPPDLSEDNLSLKQGYDRRAISLLARLDRSGNILDYRFVRSLIRVQRRLTYDEVNESLKTDELFQEMHEMSQRMRRKRMNQGGINLSLPDAQVKFNPDSSISIELSDQNTPSRIIISELMIFYNWLAATFCRDNQIPILFRTQKEPSETFPLEGEEHVYYVFRQRRKLRPLHIDTTPGSHSVLGLDLYTHVTSPIRRYLDLVIQRQMSGFLAGTGPVYNNKELEEIRISVEPVIKDLGRVKRDRLRYWIIKFLSQHPGEIYEALIIDELRSKYRIVMDDFFIVAEIKRRDGIMLRPGEKIFVTVKKADQWNDILELAYADQESITT